MHFMLFSLMLPAIAGIKPERQRGRKVLRVVLHHTYGPAR